MINGRSNPAKYTEMSQLPQQMVLFEHWDGAAGGEAGDEQNRGAAGGESDDMLIPFAFEETLCRDVGQGLVPPSIHLWSHQGGVALGLRDSKLPYAGVAMRKLEEQGIRTAVRHSGGAAVPLDEGVINLSLILPKTRGKLDFHDDFRLMASLITEAVAISHPLAAAQIEAGEITHSYCPGDFDLAIGGRKFCGIAQRRQSHAYFVHAFIVVSGSGQQRGELIHRFYQDAAGGEAGLSYPDVWPETIAGLQELGGPDTTGVFASALQQVLTNRGIHVKSAAVLANETGYTLGYEDIRVLEAAQKLRERYA